MPEDKEGLKKGDNVALIHPCASSEHNEDSLLTEVWYLEYTRINIMAPPMDKDGNIQGNGRGVRTSVLKPKLYLVNIQTIVEIIFVVEEMPLIKRYIRPLLKKTESMRVVFVRDMDLWPYYLDF
jgi:hypothetical protein